MYFTGLIIAVCTFLIIGFCHPLVIKAEYYYGTRPWVVFLVVGVACVIASLLIEQTVASALIGVLGASLLWSIGELFSQKKRVEKGWFPMNPKRKNEYQKIDQDETLCPVRKGKTLYDKRP
ncbi:MAG TPA: DUF4491 domain-containing protein [Prevotella sp.]|nr:DUF4491 domain-containing protein [Prevotella sp.]